MSDFLDRFGAQLSDVQHTMPTQAVARRPMSRLWRGTTRRSLVAVGATLALAAPAVALVSAWDPGLERPGIDKPVNTDPAPVSPSAVNALAVLRRGQTEDDRRIATPLVKAIGMGNQVDRVQTAGIRAVAPRWALVPAKVVKSGPSAVDADQLCLTDGATVGCSSADRVTENGVAILSAGQTGTHLRGVVPDGVTRVRFTPETGAAVDVSVDNNFYSLSVSELAPSRTIKAPPGYDGPAEIPAPPTPVSGTLQWLDGTGRVVGPARQRLG